MRGTVADTDDVLEIKNGAGTQTFAVTGAGDIPGNDITGNNIPGSNITATGQTGSTLATVLTPTGTTQTVNWNNGNAQAIDLGSATGDVTLTLTNPVAGFSYQILIIQGATFRDVILPSSVITSNGTAPLTIDITEIDDAYDAITLTFYGGNYIASIAQNFG